MGELIQAIFVLFLSWVVYMIIIFIIASKRKVIQATSKVAIRRCKEYCESSSLINNIQNKISGFTEDVKTELKTQTLNESFLNIDHSVLDKQCNPDTENDINEHFFTIKCNNCKLQNEIKRKTIHYFPYCMSCKEPMFDISNNTHRESIMKYVIANKQGINEVVYKKLQAVLTA